MGDIFRVYDLARRSVYILGLTTTRLVTSRIRLECLGDWPRRAGWDLKQCRPVYNRYKECVAVVIRFIVVSFVAVLVIPRDTRDRRLV